MSESTTPAQCSDADWFLARKCGLFTATPGTNTWDAALGRFAAAIRATPAPETAPSAAEDARYSELLAEYHEACADAAINAKDAERYRWLCDGNGYFMEEHNLCGHDNEKAEADEAIDTAMSARSE